MKHRPTDFNQVLGNRNLIAQLETFLENGNVPHAILFSGPSGCGKTTLARILATKLGCGDMDFIEVNAANFNGVDDIRKITKVMHSRPRNGAARVWLIDEAHKLTSSAQSAFLKPLEDAPRHVYFILATTDPTKFSPAVNNRLTAFTVEALPEKKIHMLLRKIASEEKIKVPPKIIEGIIDLSFGSARQALVLLNSIIYLSEDKMMEAIERDSKREKQIIDLCRALFKKEPWKNITVILIDIEEEPETVRRMVLGYCNSILLKNDNTRAYNVLCCFAENFFNIGRPGLTIACYDAIHI